MATKSKIYIKPSKRGSLRKAMGAKKGQKLSVSAMRGRLKNASPAIRKKLQFALNARKWKHEDGGYLPEYGYGGPYDINPTQQFASNVGAIGGGIAGIGSGLIDAFARPDELGEDFRAVDINEGARAGKGALTGAATGAAAGSMVLPGIGTLIGGAIGGIGGALSGWFGGKKEEKEGNIAMRKRLNAFQSTNRLSTMEQSPTYLPVAKQGGFTIYKGETHDGPTGGILTDEQGNPTGLSGNKPIALTEKNEVSRFDPYTGSTYIYSDSLGFAKPATRLVNKFKLNKSNSLYKYDPLLREAVDKQFDNLTTAQEFAKETKTSTEESLGMFKKGGRLTSTKAKEMLRDGTAHKKPLTARQKRYFGWIAGGRKEFGGLLPKYQEPNPTGYLPEDDWRFYNNTPMGTVYDPMSDTRTNLSTTKYNKLRLRDAFIPFGAGDVYPAGWSPSNLPPMTQDDVLKRLRPGSYNTEDAVMFSLPKTVQSQGSPTTPFSAVPTPPVVPKTGTSRGSGIGVTRSAPGVGIPTTAPAMNTKSRFGNSLGFNFANQDLLKTKSLGTPGVSEESPFNPQLNPLGHVLSAAGNLADYFAMKKAKPTDVSLPRVGAERIDLSRQRLINERGASAARATNVANTRKLGMNAGATFSNLAGANTGVSRLLGEQNMQSLMAQESANAQMQQQANMVNAQMGAEEAIMNTEQQNAYRAAMARMNPIGNVARTAAGYFKDNAAYGQGYDTLQMLAPNAELYGPNETIWDRFRKPKVRLRDKTL